MTNDECTTTNEAPNPNSGDGVSDEAHVKTVATESSSFGIRNSSFLTRYLTAFLDLVYPRRCEICQKSLEAKRNGAARWLCNECLDQLPRIDPPFCNVCGEPCDGPMTDSFRYRSE